MEDIPWSILVSSTAFILHMSMVDHKQLICLADIEFYNVSVQKFPVSLHTICNTNSFLGIDVI